MVLAFALAPLRKDKWPWVDVYTAGSGTRALRLSGEENAMEREELAKAVSDALSLEKCASEALLIPEFVENWNRLRPKFPISLMPMNRTPIQAMVDRACQVPPVLWSDETRAEFFLCVEQRIRLPVLEKMLAAVEDVVTPDCLTA